MIGNFLRAMVGIPIEPPSEDVVSSLIENGVAETMAMGGWIVAWVVTTALLLITGRLVSTWSQASKRSLLTIVAIPLAVSAMGVIIHLCRASLAVYAGRRLARKRRSPGAYDVAVRRLTNTTPLVLLPQVVLGILGAVFLSSNTV